MKRYLTHPWFGSVLLSGLLALGCGHSRQHCHCSCSPCGSPVTGQVVLLPSTSMKPREVVATPVKLEDPHAGDSVMVPMAFPAPEGSSAGSVTGTVTLTADEARALDIRPGYTPGAMYVPASTYHVTAKVSPAENAEKPSQPAPAFLPADLAK